MKQKLFTLLFIVMLSPTSTVFAQSSQTSALDPLEILATIIYGVIGILLCVVGYFAFDKVAGLDLQRELVEDQNLSLGIMLAGVFIGIAIVVSAAIA